MTTHERTSQRQCPSREGKRGRERESTTSPDTDQIRRYLIAALSNQGLTLRPFWNGLDQYSSMAPLDDFTCSHNCIPQGKAIEKTHPIPIGAAKIRRGSNHHHQQQQPSTGMWSEHKRNWMALDIRHWSPRYSGEDHQHDMAHLFIQTSQNKLAHY